VPDSKLLNDNLDSQSVDLQQRTSQLIADTVSVVEHEFDSFYVRVSTITAI